MNDLQTAWNRLEELIKRRFNAPAKPEALFFLVGMREMGLAPRAFSKQEKTDLMHVGLCTLLEPYGYYRKTGRDDDGWPHWELVRPLPHMDFFGQSAFVREILVEYFKKIWPQIVEP
ncbi:MAG: hypothetical protein RMM53_01660 [Bacteroidia bacterium]|nr:hypothetical protein [Bacteroidia bacterium]MDW8332899.1 hypothetical protein [Bacteroidia bacterium]